MSETTNRVEKKESPHTDNQIETKVAAVIRQQCRKRMVRSIVHSAFLISVSFCVVAWFLHSIESAIGGELDPDEDIMQWVGPSFPLAIAASVISISIGVISIASLYVRLPRGIEAAMNQTWLVGPVRKLLILGYGLEQLATTTPATGDENTKSSEVGSGKSDANKNPAPFKPLLILSNHKHSNQIRQWAKVSMDQLRSGISANRLFDSFPIRGSQAVFFVTVARNAISSPHESKRHLKQAEEVFHRRLWKETVQRAEAMVMISMLLSAGIVMVAVGLMYRTIVNSIDGLL